MTTQALFGKPPNGNWGIIRRTPNEMRDQPTRMLEIFQREINIWRDISPDWEFKVDNEFEYKHTNEGSIP